jgi:hypothetical protein
LTHSPHLFDQLHFRRVRLLQLACLIRDNQQHRFNPASQFRMFIQVFQQGFITQAHRILSYQFWH